MLKVFRGWVERYLSDEEAIVFLVLLVVGFAIIIGFGEVLAPVLIAIVLAYLLQGGLQFCKARGLGHLWSAIIVFIVFVGVCLGILLGMVPALITQSGQLFYELPGMLTSGQDLLMLLPERYPELVSAEQVDHWILQATDEVASLGQWVLSFSLHSIPGIITLLIYFVLVPILVFFFLKDGPEIVRWLTGFLPRERPLMNTIWAEMDVQIANYIRGKVIEIVIVGFVTYIAFLILDLNYAALLAILIGLSVLIPYIGAAVVTVPVAVIGYFQWGWTDSFFIVLIVHGVIQALDGNILVPLLFSEAVNLHPVAIIIAVLAFGGIWGFWGIFFAIPLATLLKAVLTAWPRGVQKTEA